MNRYDGIAVLGLVLLLPVIRLKAGVPVVVDHNDSGCSTAAFRFDRVPAPSRDSAALHATFTIVSGRADPNGGALDCLHDGKLPEWENQPKENFFFDGRTGGSLLVDLGRAIDIGQVNTYSWHCLTRAPQVYTLYAADGRAEKFQLKPPEGTAPGECGWDRIADVDSRPKSGDATGQYGVSIGNAAEPVGHYRYLLFEIQPAEANDEFGNTFYSEFNVVARDEITPVTAASSKPSEAASQTDPMDWKPPAQPPPLRERYDAATYARLRADALSRIDLAALRAPGRPTDGVIVTAVDPGSQAAGLGIKPGDILMTVDGNQVGPSAGDVDLGKIRTNVPQRLTFWSARKGQQTVAIQPGLLGVDTYEGWRAAEAYARSSERNPQWDEDMLVAVSTFMTNADLAETALARAVKAGYHGRLFVPLAMRIAFAQCRFEQALAWEWPSFLSGQRLGSDTVKLLNDAALLDFKLDQSLALAKIYPAAVGDEQEVGKVAAAYRDKPKDHLGDLFKALPKLSRRRCRQFDAFVSPLGPEFAETSKWAVQFFNAYQPVEFQIPSGHFQHLQMRPGFANAELAVHFRLHDTDQETTPFERCVWFGLYDVAVAEQNPKANPDFRVVLCSNGAVEILPFAMHTIHFRPAVHFSQRGQMEGTLRIILLHNRCEVTLDDGTRLYRGPAMADESRRKYGFTIQTIGMTGQIFPPVWESIHAN